MLGIQNQPFSNLSQQHPTCRNMSQQGGQTHATGCAQQCCDVLRWHVAIVWPGLKSGFLPFPLRAVPGVSFTLYLTGENVSNQNV